jgi:hypothetical protein
MMTAESWGTVLLHDGPSSLTHAVIQYAAAFTLIISEYWIIRVRG